MQADVVLEGGGVKGIGLVGALSTLTGAGYQLERVAGTSAGAVVGALVAAGVDLERLRQLLHEVDYGAFADVGLLDRFGPVGVGLSVVLEKGIYEGAHLRRWLGERLAELGVETFGDLRREDPDSHLPVEHRYRLVVMVSDVSRGRLVRLPWDYPDYGLDPDAQRVTDAVFASAAVPLFYEPPRLEHRDGQVSWLVDGGLLSNFPVDAFDRDDSRPPRWPTIGIKLSGRPDSQQQIVHPVTGTISYLRAVVATLLSATDQRHLDDPCVVDRTIFVDTSGVSSVDFDINPATRERLFEAGRKAADRWLARWDWDDHLARCRA